MTDLGRISNGHLTFGHVLAAVIPVLAIVGPMLGFYIHDRDTVADKFRDAYVRIGDNSARNVENKKAIENLVDWRKGEEAYDSEVRNRFHEMDDRVNSVANRLHQRIDTVQLLLIEKVLGKVPNNTMFQQDGPP